MKDTKSLLLVLLSVGLIGTWIYHLYDKTAYSKRRTEVFIKDSVAVAQAVQDSLQKMYTYTINDLGTQLVSTKDTANLLQQQLNKKVAQINNLKKEIAGILGKKGLTREELAIARQKIAELQQGINELRNSNLSIEEEKQRLSGQLTQLSGEMTGLQQNVKRLDDENKVLTEKVNLAGIFVASEINLCPITVKNAKEEETTKASKVSKFVISFAVQNNINEYESADVYLVLTQPDGTVVKNDDAWEISSMETKNEGKKSFTRKVRFEYLKGETHRVLFSLNADNYQKGNYTMQLYHNGMMIGKVVKTLS